MSLNCKYEKHSNSSIERTESILRSIYKSSSSEEEHMENALALGADEGRDKLRKAAVSCK